MHATPKGTDYEEVGFVYNRGILSSLLREGMGFDGIINSDTGPINNMPWGVEVLSIQERYQKALKAGCDLFSGGGGHGEPDQDRAQRPGERKPSG